MRPSQVVQGYGAGPLERQSIAADLAQPGRRHAGFRRALDQPSRLAGADAQDLAPLVLAESNRMA